jgi:trehalose 6-phosphate synthase
MKQRVLLASNRGPISYHFGADGTLTGQRGGGGLISGVTSGLAGMTAESEVTWVCAPFSDADRAAARRQDAGDAADGGNATDSGDAPDSGDAAEAGDVALPAGLSGPAGVRVRMLDIAPDTFDRAYNNVANSILWFVHHLLFDTPNQPQFGLEFRRDWQSYLAYNEAFAAAMADEARADEARVPVRALIQDYHLSLAPRMLRQRLAPRLAQRPGGTADLGIAHFSHTPWAPPDYYRMLPDEVGRAVLAGILGADQAGFHAARWADAFLDCCEAILGAQVIRSPARGAAQADWVLYDGHATEVAVHPLGIDAAALRARAGAADVRDHITALRQAARGRKLIVRVDRTELSKNIVRGLAAYRELLATRPEWHGRVVHLAFAYPSRSAVPEYRAYTELVERTARQIAAEFRTPDWEPVILEVRDDYARSLAACTVGDVLLVNPIRDGMNLVAQEGPVLSRDGCALVLSREAGAAATLGPNALLVNPYDVSETAAALHQALAMPDDERRRRSAALAATAEASPPARWLGDQLAALDR